MNFSVSDFSVRRQRCRQWVPLITQQLRLRHVYQIIAFNLQSDRKNSFYFTLHSTSMSSPFYTSEKICVTHPKWPEIVLKHVNTSCSAVVIRIWQQGTNGDKIIVSWGVNFSGLTYLGKKLADIQPRYFKTNTVIFSMQGGYFTSHEYIRGDLVKAPPFSKSLNVIDTLNGKVLFRRIAVISNRKEVQCSYKLEGLRKLHSLQLEIKKKRSEVEEIKDRINSVLGTHSTEDVQKPSASSLSNHSVRYAPQLLTMNSLNKMLHEKPTKVQRIEMSKVSKDIEVAKFETRLLSQERDRKCVSIRQLKQKLAGSTDENEERNSNLMDKYYKLSKESERLKEYKKSLIQHKELLSQIASQLLHRRRQLMRELLFIYPIEKISNDKYTILGISLTECSDSEVSIALGYISHVLTMCSSFMHVPLRYPVTHCGSRSYVTDQISSGLAEKERDFPLYTKGKEKSHFAYAVHLLNKNVSQLRWLVSMQSTSDLNAILANLLAFLQASTMRPPDGIASTERLVSLTSFPASPALCDPILDCIRREDRPGSKFRQTTAKSCGRNECPRGLSEILAVPEDYLSKRITEDSFKSYMKCETSMAQLLTRKCCEPSCGQSSSSKNPTENLITIKTGIETLQHTNNEYIEEGTDPLNPSPIVTKSIKITADNHRKRFNVAKRNRISRSEGSYTDDDRSFLRPHSEPLLGETSERSLSTWLEYNTNTAEGSENGTNGESSSSLEGGTDRLTVRTDKLLTTTSFNLVRTKQSNGND